MIETRKVKKGALHKTEQIFVPKEKLGSKAIREEAVIKMTVIISTGKEFDADDRSRLNMICAIDASQFLGRSESLWRLANNVEVLVTLNEMREANAKALLEFGNIVGVQ